MRCGKTSCMMRQDIRHDAWNFLSRRNILSKQGIRPYHLAQRTER